MEIGEDRIIVDNTPGLDYTNELTKFHQVHHLEIPTEPGHTRFQRVVTESANYIRDYFLLGEWKYLVIIESDVIVPKSLLNLFDEAMSMADNWGAIGGYYYRGFHDYEKWGKYPYVNKECTSLEKTQHVLSGCTVYHRDVIEQFDFRYDERNLEPFPDAWICYDINKHTTKNLYNYPKIICAHESDEFGKRH